MRHGRNSTYSHFMYLAELARVRAAVLNARAVDSMRAGGRQRDRAFMCDLAQHWSRVKLRMISRAYNRNTDDLVAVLNRCSDAFPTVVQRACVSAGWVKSATGDRS